jgi:prepilin-type N-terminal cleavage/methylation domain-containing protein/prepilin-type processing-associated H-X9-DG protein
MKGKAGFTLIELLVVIAIIAILASILFPIYSRTRRLAQASNCQANLKQIGSAMKMYLSDWDDTYPTNRNISGGVTSSVTSECNLSRQNSQGEPEVDPTTGAPYKFDYSINWVEGLYQYVEVVTKTDDPASSWKCQAASVTRRPGLNCGVNYSFNGCLAEQPDGIVKSSQNLMMCRELASMFPAELRPTNPAAATSSDTANSPNYAFLNAKDASGAVSNFRLHANGSHVLFVDGHVKLLDASFYPEKNYAWASSAYDPETNQWYNYVYGHPHNPKQKMLNKTIAITP